MAISNCLFSPTLRQTQDRPLKILADFQFGVYLQSLPAGRKVKC